MKSYNTKNLSSGHWVELSYQDRQEREHRAFFPVERVEDNKIIVGGIVFDSNQELPSFSRKIVRLLPFDEAITQHLGHALFEDWQDVDSEQEMESVVDYNVGVLSSSFGAYGIFDIDVQRAILHIITAAIEASRDPDMNSDVTKALYKRLQFELSDALTKRE